jgi:hypothetical protein
MQDGEPDPRLREIIVRHTVVGGYPDTMAIARDAYALALSDAATTRAMTLERTVWNGSSKEDETVSMEAWIGHAPHAALDMLLTERLRMEHEADQSYLAEIWRDCATANGDRADMRETADLVTYHWREGDRLALKAAVARLRPNHLKPDPNQGSLL